ncbi:MAG: hypothetical protein HY898_10225 [Deltaproteobacteria bacterium]|nr:hypothetical protein [Deltaproteobacteria bacterium]
MYKLAMQVSLVGFTALAALASFSCSSDAGGAGGAAGGGSGGFSLGGTGGNNNPGGSGGIQNQGGSGGYSNPGGSGGTMNPGGSGGASSCQTCMDGQCGNEMKSCNQDCSSLLSCAFACSDNACVSSCANQYPNGVQGAQAVINCMNGHCAQPCGGGGGGAGGSSAGGSGGSSSNPCNDCVSSKCGSQLQACTGECSALLQCAQSCSDQSCVDDCANQHPSGVQPAQDLLNCVNSSCASVCQ